MDALALFCNLHGDGPETLAALREAGCERLAQVADMDPDLLGAVIGREASGVGRFQREAAVLARRVEGEVRIEAEAESQVEAEAVAQARPEPEPSVLQPAARELRANDRERELLASLEFNPKEVQARTQQIHEQFERTAEQAERVAEQVKEARVATGSEGQAAPKLDRIAQLASPKEPSIGPVAAAVLDLWRSLDQPGDPQGAEGQPLPGSAAVVMEATPESAADAPLAALAGLGDPVIDALARIGIESVAALAAADPLDLARRTTLPYTHLAHVTFLARRSAAELPKRAPEPAPPAHVEASADAQSAEVEAESARDESPTAEWSEAGLTDEREAPPEAGGPFA